MPVYDCLYASVCACLAMLPCFCLPSFLPACLSVSLRCVCLSVCLFPFSVSVRQSACLPSVCLSPLGVSVCQSVCLPPVCLSVCLSACCGKSEMTATAGKGLFLSALVGTVYLSVFFFDAQTHILPLCIQRTRMLPCNLSGCSVFRWTHQVSDLLRKFTRSGSGLGPWLSLRLSVRFVFCFNELEGFVFFCLEDASLTSAD